MSANDEVLSKTAVELRRLIGSKELSPVELLEACIERIAQINPAVNAVTATCYDRARKEAKAAETAAQQGEALGILHGLPTGIKDLEETGGLLTTFGSQLYRDYVPAHDSAMVARVRAAGAIVIGKTNVPEFGLGSQTFNKVFGPTHNPYDLSKTCGGSTGGGATALACGMIPLADGSDMGGSLRNPPNFCNVVGLRPSPGRVPDVPTNLGWFTLAVPGPVARNVTDCAFFLSVLAGFDPHSPISIDQPGSQFAAPLSRDFKGVRVAMFRDLGLPWEQEVKSTVQAQRKVFESLGCIVEEAEPDFTDANECFLAWRHWATERSFGDALATHSRYSRRKFTQRLPRNLSRINNKTT